MATGTVAKDTKDVRKIYTVLVTHNFLEAGCVSSNSISSSSNSLVWLEVIASMQTTDLPLLLLSGQIT